MFDQQLTIDGGAKDIAPSHRQDRLFNAPKTMRGQTTMDTDEKGPAGIPYVPHRPRCHFGRSHVWIMEGDAEEMCQCATCGSASSAHPRYGV